MSGGKFGRSLAGFFFLPCENRGRAKVKVEPPEGIEDFWPA